MAEPLKNFFDARLVRSIGESLRRVWPAFPLSAFVRRANKGLDELELLDRGRHLARALREALPSDYPEAVGILVRSLGDPLKDVEGNGMAPFFYLPHTIFVGEYGLDHFDVSMEAQHALTKRFTCEFSIRFFFDRHEARTLRVLEGWARDPDPHVRRLVSEGTRPRLPWAMRLRRFQEDPAPVLRLLELLKDDPELFVRRSVANNLNDIAKDHPDRAVEVCRRWLRNATDERRWIVRHALRSLVKKGHPEALALLGFEAGEHLQVKGTVHPRRVRSGEKVEITLQVRNTGDEACAVQTDLVVHYVKANGAARPKVFKGAGLKLGPGERRDISVRVSLREMTTRRHHPGEHRVEARVNGRDVAVGGFILD